MVEGWGGGLGAGAGAGGVVCGGEVPVDDAPEGGEVGRARVAVVDVVGVLHGMGGAVSGLEDQGGSGQGEMGGKGIEGGSRRGGGQIVVKG